MSRKTVIIILTITLIIIGLVFTIFKPKKINSAKWAKTYSLSSDQPYGLSVFKELLNHQYSPEAIKICDGLCELPEGDAHGYSYLYIGDNFFRPQNYLNKLIDFSKRGGRVLIVSELMYLNIDTVTIDTEYKYVNSDGVTLQSSDGLDFSYKHVIFGLDSTSDKSFYSIAPLNSFPTIAIDTIISIQDTMSIFNIVNMDSAQLLLHTLPDMFANVTMKYGDGLRHYNYVMNYKPQSTYDNSMKEKSETLLLDTEDNKFKASTDKESILLDTEDNIISGNGESAFNPIQIIFTNPAFKWAYLLILVGSVSYIYFKGKRRQQAIPTLATNENTSLEFVDTLSDLFRSQNTPSRLVEHMEENVEQFINRKYFININSVDYIKRISQKSKIDEVEISTLFKRIKAAKNNVRFREEQLINLNQTIEEFYKKCQ